MVIEENTLPKISCYLSEYQIYDDLMSMCAAKAGVINGELGWYKTLITVSAILFGVYLPFLLHIYFQLELIAELGM